MLGKGNLKFGKIVEDKDEKIRIWNNETSTDGPG